MNSSLTDIQKNNKFIFVVEEGEQQRLDKFLSTKMAGYSRSKIKELIEIGNVKISNSENTDPSYKIKLGQAIEVSTTVKKENNAIPANIPLDIIYEDDDLVVINKQAGLTVHPGAGNHNDTLVNALVAHFGKNLSSLNGADRPGIVHRLDRDTTGLMIVAKNDRAHASLGKQIEKRAFKRVYNALVFGVPNPESGRIEKNIGRSKLNRKKMAIYRNGGRVAVTNYKVIKKYFDCISLVECRLETGRTHQIRVHMTSIGNSLLGDKAYGNSKKKLSKTCPVEIADKIHNFPRQALHSTYISFQHPTSGKTMEFQINLPPDIKDLLELTNPK